MWLMANVQIAAVCPIKLLINDPVLGFHILRVESEEPDALFSFGNVVNVLSNY